MTWDDLATIRGWTDLPLVLKGIVTAEDARLAVDHGVDGVVVSNHGARQLDRVRATADALGEVVAAVDGRTEVWVDGGIRRGLDVAVALRHGRPWRPRRSARSTGRSPPAEPRASTRALAVLREEFEIALALLGAPDAGRPPAGPPRRRGADDRLSGPDPRLRWHWTAIARAPDPWQGGPWATRSRGHTSRSSPLSDL